MSDPDKKLDSENVPSPAPGTPVAAPYPGYDLLVKLAETGPIVARIDGPHTSADLALAPNATKIRVRVTHNPAGTTPNLNVIIESV